MSTQPIKIYISTWCGDCRRVLTYLNEKGVPYTAVNIDSDPEAAKVVMALNRGFRSVPTLIFSDGSHLVEPTLTQLDEALARHRS